MEQAEYFELNRKLSNFYVKEISPALNLLNKKRKQKAIVLFLCIALLISFALCFVSIAIPKLFLCLVLIIISLVIAIKISFKKFRITYLSFKLEDDFKRRFMDDFVKLFGNLHWRKYGINDDTAILLSNKKIANIVQKHNVTITENNKVVNLNLDFYKNIEKVKSLDLFNLAALSIDDCICGSYKNVPFSIIEAKTISKLSILSGVLTGFLLFYPIILVILILGLIGIIIIISHYYQLIDTLVKFGLPKPMSVILSASIFIFGIKFIIQLLINKLMSWAGKFRGIIVEFAMNKNFEGQTIILDNSQDGRNVSINKKKYSVVQLEDIEFMKKYTVYSTNQIEARYLITTAFIDRLKNIKTKFKTKYIRVAFKDDKIVIALHTDRDMFKMANMTSDTGKQTFIALFEEIVSVLDFINQLKLNKKLGL